MSQDVDVEMNGEDGRGVAPAGHPQDPPERVTSPMDPRGLYHVLGVTKDSTVTEIRQAYKHAAKLWHPDKNKHPQATSYFQFITEAYGVLSDNRLKSAYDRGDTTDLEVETAEGMRNFHDLLSELFRSAYAEFGIDEDLVFQGMELDELLFDVGFVHHVGSEESDDDDDDSSDDLGLPSMINVNSRGRGSGRGRGRGIRGSGRTFRGDRGGAARSPVRSRGVEERPMTTNNPRRSYRGNNLRRRGRDGVEPSGYSVSQQSAVDNSSAMGMEDHQQFRGRGRSRGPRRRGGGQRRFGEQQRGGNYQQQQQPRDGGIDRQASNDRQGIARQGSNGRGRRETREEFMERMIREAPGIFARGAERQRRGEFGDDDGW